MSKIRIIQSLSTELTPGWGQIETLEIASRPFNEGAFGEIFDCHGIDRQQPPRALVVKLFKPDPSGNHRRGYETIRKLQGRVRAKNQELAARGQSLANIPGLYALPQFSFEGQWQGQTWLGYAAHKLDPRRFSALDDILQTQFRAFRLLTWDKKLQLALDLAECLDRLRELNYIHADINPHNLFIDLRDGHLVLIDYDSGVVVNRPTDAPTTYGKQSEWLAPEVYAQLSRASGRQARVTVDLFTDIWSVAVGIHYFLFARFPYFYLKVMGPREIQEYLRSYRWPDIDPGFGNFNPAQARIYADYRETFANSRSDLRRPFEATFHEGAMDKGRRVTYGQWTTLLRRLLANPTPFAPSADYLPPLPESPEPPAPPKAQPPTPVRPPTPMPAKSSSSSSSNLNWIILIVCLALAALAMGRRNAPEAPSVPHSISTQPIPQ